MIKQSGAKRLNKHLMTVPIRLEEKVHVLRPLHMLCLLQLLQKQFSSSTFAAVKLLSVEDILFTDDLY